MAGAEQSQGFGELMLPLSFPQDGLRFDNLVLRVPGPTDLQALAAAFTDGELNEADNISPFSPAELAERRPPSSTLARLVVADVETGVILGGGTLHHLDRSEVSSRSAIGSIRGHAVAESLRGRSRIMRSHWVSNALLPMSRLVTTRRSEFSSGQGSHARASFALRRSAKDAESIRPLLAAPRRVAE
jgi:hypothetical protein